MKVAVCLSGHSRNYKLNYPNWNFEADTFISSCYESGLPKDGLAYTSYHSMGIIKTDLADTNDILIKYQPKKHIFKNDTVIETDLIKFYDYKTKHNCQLVHIGMMFYRIYQSNQLKKSYEFENNFKYDFVIRSRFDVKINDIWFSRDNLFATKNDEKVNDLFFFGNSILMDALSDCYLWFIKQKPHFLCEFDNAESILNYYVEMLNLNHDIINEFDITFNKDYPIQRVNIKNGLQTIIYGE
jgi:hypothetical protein